MVVVTAEALVTMVAAVLVGIQVTVDKVQVLATPRPALVVAVVAVVEDKT
jgi:hypothetical protein